MLASLVQSVRTLSSLAPEGLSAQAKEEDDDPVPKDIDEFRLALARRIRGFIEARQAQQAKQEEDQRAVGETIAKS